MASSVALLAGGLATRLRPVTETIPKALVEVCAEPFINYQLRYLQKQGITDVVLCLGYLGEMIEEVVGDGSSYELNVSYSYDGDKLLGTGGAIKKAIGLLGESFFILYGDSFLPVNFKAVEKTYLKAGKTALITVLRNDDRWDKSNVLYKDGKLIEYNKSNPRPEMNFIDYGLGVIKASAFDNFSNNQVFDLADLYYQLSIQDEMSGFEVFERFYEIGSFSGLKETEDYICKGYLQ